MPVTTHIAGLPDELRVRFLALRTIRDVAGLLQVSEDHLRYLAFYRRKAKYRQFYVRKRREGRRLLAEPIPPLKLLQTRLASVLRYVYQPRSSVHGFIAQRSIATNAQKHTARRLVLNLDLCDFFPSINFGRIRGMLLAQPYGLGGPAATVLAQLCCYQNSLPQGAPTSPVLSNMICKSLDRDLELIARKARCRYTRYADDLTFSTQESAFRPELVTDTSTSPITLGGALRSAIESHGFRINDSKIRIQGRAQRQIVTGLTVNSIPNVRRQYIRRVRAMLHAWRRYGHDAAQAVFSTRDNKDRGPHRSQPSFRRVVKGKLDFLAMVRGNSDAIYRRFISEYAALDPDYRPRPGERRKPSHLKSYRDAIWVLETDTLEVDEMYQGTAFELDGYGLVTCAHVVRKPALAYRPSAPEARFPIRVEAKSEGLDVALLSFEGSSGQQLKPSRAIAKQGDSVRLVGYPAHAPGSSIYEESGSITGFRAHMGHQRIVVSMPIVGGASGSPILDSSYRVVGIAAKGRSGADKDNASVQSIAIPISALDQLVGEG